MGLGVFLQFLVSELTKVKVRFAKAVYNSNVMQRDCPLVAAVRQVSKQAELAVKQRIHIDPEKCTGCGTCVNACHMGALALIDGKARLVDEHHCDGLGRCIGECPFGAISFEDVPTDRPKPRSAAHPASRAGGCPGRQNLVFSSTPGESTPSPAFAVPSALTAWPIQLHLIRPSAPQFQGSDVLIAASCSAFSTGRFHTDLLPGKALIIACPKLDDQTGYLEKLIALFRDAAPASVTIARMSVPCCQGLTRLVLEARHQASSTVPVKEIVVGVEGEFLGQTEIPAVIETHSAERKTAQAVLQMY